MGVIEKIKVYDKIWKLVEVRDINGNRVAFYEDQYGNIRAFYAEDASDRALLRRRMFQGRPLWLAIQEEKFRKESNGND